MHIWQYLLYSTAFCFTDFATLAQQNFIDSSTKPEVFGPNIISTPYTEWSTTFTPDGNTVYFSQGAIYCTICFSKKVNGYWTKPQVANFSGLWRDTDPFISPDGSKIFFSSNRPIERDRMKPEKTFQLWYVDHISADEWSAPKYLDSPVNLRGINSAGPSVSENGTLYFCSVNRDGHPGWGSFSSRWNGREYEKPILLKIEGAETMMDPFVSFDEKYLIFASGNDLYISFKKNKDWSRAIKLPTSVNNGNANQSPSVSRDGKILYYSSARDRGFYQRNVKGKPLNYDELVTEMQSLFNGGFNILMVPINL
ncbi:MAG TPA: hypothetical protein VKR53_01465 [Puia sp.]|nr:hypothetical protein [Puia sp.]